MILSEFNNVKAAVICPSCGQLIPFAIIDIIREKKIICECGLMLHFTLTHENRDKFKEIENEINDLYYGAVEEIERKRELENQYYEENEKY